MRISKSSEIGSLYVSSRKMATEEEFRCCNGGSSKLGWVAEILVRLLLMLIFGLSALIIEPFVRYVQPQDWPSHNYPHSDPESIPPEAVFVAIVVVPLFLLLIVIIFGRCKMWPVKYENKPNKKQLIGQRVCSEITVFFLASSMGYLLNGVFTDVVKNLYGRPRPDFLSRCYTPDQFKSIDSNKWLTLPSRLNNQSNTEEQMEAIRATAGDAIPFPYVEDVKPLITAEDCINQDDHFLRKGGRRSFPSGHTSFSFAGATFCALYSMFWLRKIHSNVRLRTLVIPGESLGIFMFFVFYVPAFWVAISRTQDYRHFATDTIAGAVIGTFTVYVSFIHYYDISIFKAAIRKPEYDGLKKCDEDDEARVIQNGESHH